MAKAEVVERAEAPLAGMARSASGGSGPGVKRRRTWVSWAGAVLFLVALGLRLGAAVDDLPHLYDYDEPLFVGLDIGPMWLDRTAEPAEFHHPAMYKSLSASVLFAAEGITGWDAQDLNQSGVYGDRLVENPMPWVTLRILVGVLGAAAVVLCWDAARRFGAPDWAAATAGLLGAVAPLLIGTATRIASDGFVVFFVMVAVWTLAWTLQRPSLARQALLGASIGLAVSTKYTAVPVVVFALSAPWVALRSWPRRLTWWAAAGAAAAAAFFVVNPYIPLRFDQFFDEMRAQNLVYSLGQVGQMGRPSQFNLRSLLENGGPLAIGALAAVPLLATARARSSDATRSTTLVGAVTLSVAVVAWLAFQSTYQLRVTRNVMPLVLPLCVLGSLALEPFWSMARRRSWVVAGSAVLLFSGWMGLQVAKGGFETARSLSDERAEARAWLSDHVAAGEVVVGELGAPWIGKPTVDQREVALLADIPMADLDDGTIDWIVSSSESTSGIFRDEARWERYIANYEPRLSSVCEWHRFRSWNTEIRVGRVCDPSESGRSSSLVGG